MRCVRFSTVQLVLAANIVGLALGVILRFWSETGAALGVCFLAVYLFFRRSPPKIRVIGGMVLGLGCLLAVGLVGSDGRSPWDPINILLAVASYNRNEIGQMACWNDGGLRPFAVFIFCGVMLSAACLAEFFIRLNRRSSQTHTK